MGYGVEIAVCGKNGGSRMVEATQNFRKNCSGVFSAISRVQILPSAFIIVIRLCTAWKMEHQRILMQFLHRLKQLIKNIRLVNGLWGRKNIETDTAIYNRF